MKENNTYSEEVLAEIEKENADFKNQVEYEHPLIFMLKDKLKPPHIIAILICLFFVGFTVGKINTVSKSAYLQVVSDMTKIQAEGVRLNIKPCKWK